jgi:hypothetical protein
VSIPEALGVSDLLGGQAIAFGCRDAASRRRVKKARR